ncbi:MAG: sigma-70 family RNA polymerase sigma factor, partial [Bacteroidota bacterium]
MKNDSLENTLSANFRVYHGKLFSALLDRFGTVYVQEVEDALQNAFLKAVKSWKPDRVPQNPEGWLYTVAKNDLLNEMKKMKRQPLEGATSDRHDSAPLEDLRLKTLLFLAMNEELSYSAKVLFILKNVFGLHVREISESTLLSEEAIYKQVSRARKKLLGTSSVDLFDTT